MATRKKCIGGNWKSNPRTLADATALCGELAKTEFNKDKVEVIICCVTIHGDAVRASLGDCGIETGIQNISKTDCGAFTGEVTAGMAKEVGNNWALIGHSERRSLYGETIPETVEKLQKCLAAELKVMFCIGEQLEEREAGTTDAINRSQLEPALAVEGITAENFVIAYEPVWAIGTGKVATPEQAQETCANVRALVKEVKGEDFGNAVRIQYGGSSSPDNIEGLASQPDIDGFLVGGASLKPTFAAMITHLSNL